MLWMGIVARGWGAFPGTGAVQEPVPSGAEGRVADGPAQQYLQAYDPTRLCEMEVEEE